MTEWISVKDRLPEDGQRVVAIAENGMTGVLDYQNNGAPFAMQIMGYFSNVVWWRPLPKASKEE